MVSLLTIQGARVTAIGTRRRSVRGVRQVLVSLTALITASTLVGVLTGPAPASAAPVTEDVVTACNNTFQPTKFPLTYQVTSTPSANPVAPGASFTVDFDVSLIASASFLNGV